jgi:hypothetical protein
VSHHLRQRRNRASHRKQYQAQQRADCGHKLPAAANAQQNVARHHPSPPNIQDKNGLTLSATNHAIHLPVKYLPNASARRNCHTLPLRFDSYYESFVDHKLYQSFDVVIVFADRVMVPRYRF